MVDWDRPLVTQEGLKARLVGMLTGEVIYPYVVAIDHAGREEVVTFTVDGKEYTFTDEDSRNDLSNVREGIDWRLPVRLKNGDVLEFIRRLQGATYPIVCVRKTSVGVESICTLTEIGQVFVDGQVSVENY